MKTQRQLINEAAKSKGISIKKLCEDLNFNYASFRSEVSRTNFPAKKVLLISEYLDVDLKTLIKAPLEKPVRQNKGDK